MYENLSAKKFFLADTGKLTAKYLATPQKF